MGLMTAELSASLPSNSGLIQWSNSAFGKGSKFFTMETTLLTIFTAITDNAVYPTLFVSYLSQMFDLNWILQVFFLSLYYIYVYTNIFYLYM